MKRKRERRGKGEGSIYQRSDGLWEGQMTTGYDPLTGKQQRRTVQGKTRQEVVDKLLELRQKAKEGLLEASDMSLQTCLEYWLLSLKSQVAPATYWRYKNVVDNYLIPLLGHVKLAKLAAMHVSDLYRRMEAAGMSSGKRNKAGTVLRMALTSAVNMGLLHTNPAVKVPKPAHRSKEITPFTTEQVATFLKTASADRLFPLYVLALDSGARFGELAAVEWKDLDFNTGIISFTKSVEELHGKCRVKETKTKASRRNVKLSSGTIAVLFKYKESLEAKGQKYARIFSTRTGGFIRNVAVRKWSFNRILARAGLPKIRFHDLRHTCATLLLLAGVHVKVVSERLGHSRVTITLDTYAHVLPSMQDKAADAAGAFLFPAEPGDEKSEISRS